MVSNPLPPPKKRKEKENKETPKHPKSKTQKYGSAEQNKSPKSAKSIPPFTQYNYRNSDNWRKQSQYVDSQFQQKISLVNEYKSMCKYLSISRYK